MMRSSGEEVGQALVVEMLEKAGPAQVILPAFADAARQQSLRER
jgi:hypothetical protein